jgi:hypothetical protein
MEYLTNSNEQAWGSPNLAVHWQQMQAAGGDGRPREAPDLVWFTLEFRKHSQATTFGDFAKLEPLENPSHELPGLTAMTDKFYRAVKERNPATPLGSVHFANKAADGSILVDIICDTDAPEKNKPCIGSFLVKPGLKLTFYTRFSQLENWPNLAENLRTLISSWEKKNDQ